MFRSPRKKKEDDSFERYAEGVRLYRQGDYPQAAKLLGDLGDARAVGPLADCAVYCLKPDAIAESRQALTKLLRDEATLIAARR